MNQKFHRGEDKRVTIIQRFKLFRDYRPESKRAEPRFSAAGNYECRWKRGRRQTEREKSGRYQEGIKKKEEAGGKCHITSLYRVSEAGTRVCSGSSIRF